MNSEKLMRRLELPDSADPAQPVDYCLVTLACKDGFSVSLCSLGASIRRIAYPLPSGGFKNIALSFDQDSAYLSNPLYAGAVLAPCAGRISRGRLPLGPEGTVCTLSRNENGRHTLHGGPHNASFQNWTLLSLSQTETSARASFGLTLRDGLDGFPGNRRLKAVYTLNEQHVLTLKLEAVSDRETYFNLSNHCYFHLSGDFSRPASEHLLQIRADRYIRNAPDFIPEEEADVTGTPFDFRRPRTLKEQSKNWPSDLQLAWNRGYNHAFILKRDPSSDSLRFSDEAADGASGPTQPLPPDLVCTLPQSPGRLCISSDAPCMVLYSGGYIQEGLALADGQFSHPGCALAFEFQDYPDAPGGHGFPYRTTPAGALWERTIRYSFQ